jgi:histidinol-phosphate aminotransferase
MNRQDIETILNNFPGLVVIDEAYINFSRHRSFIQELTEYPNLVVLQTMSKAWGLAGLRLGMAFASEAIIDVYNKVKPPYNVNQATQELALAALGEVEQVNGMIRALVVMREQLARELGGLPLVQKVYPSDANFRCTGGLRSSARRRDCGSGPEQSGIVRRLFADHRRDRRGKCGAHNCAEALWRECLR